MTKEEQKADELIEIFTEHEDSEVEYGYACERALKCVDEIIKVLEVTQNTINDIQESEGKNFYTFDLNLKSWQSVKQHILNKGK